MMAFAGREELNYLFGDSISDADLLRAVEVIESTQASVDPVAQTSAVPDDVHTTAGVQSVGNIGSVSASESPQICKFCTFYYLNTSFPCWYWQKTGFPFESAILTRRREPTSSAMCNASSKMSTGQMDPWNGLGRVGLGRVGLGRAGSRFCWIWMGRIGTSEFLVFVMIIS